MLTPHTLNRVSASYARGYRDGFAGLPAKDDLAPRGPFDRQFASYDYGEGYNAGSNDRRCDAHDEAQAEAEARNWNAANRD